MQPFEQVVADNEAMVMRVCCSILPIAEAEDAWSETFLSARAAYPGLRPGSNVAAWLATIARRKAIDQTRRASRVRPTDSLPEVGSWDRSVLLSDDLRRAVVALPPKQQGAVIYRYIADLSYEDVAELLDCTPAAARRSAADGIAALRTRYAQETSS